MSFGPYNVDVSHSWQPYGLPGYDVAYSHGSGVRLGLPRDVGQLFNPVSGWPTFGAVTLGMGAWGDWGVPTSSYGVPGWASPYGGASTQAFHERSIQQPSVGWGSSVFVPYAGVADPFSWAPDSGPVNRGAPWLAAQSYGIAGLGGWPGYSAAAVLDSTLRNAAFGGCIAPSWEAARDDISKLAFATSGGVAPIVAKHAKQPGLTLPLAQPKTPDGNLRYGEPGGRKGPPRPPMGEGAVEKYGQWADAVSGSPAQVADVVQSRTGQASSAPERRADVQVDNLRYGEPGGRMGPPRPPADAATVLRQGQHTDAPVASKDQANPGTRSPVGVQPQVVQPIKRRRDDLREPLQPELRNLLSGDNGFGPYVPEQKISKPAASSLGGLPRDGGAPSPHLGEVNRALESAAEKAAAISRSSSVPEGTAAGQPGAVPPRISAPIAGLPRGRAI